MEVMKNLEELVGPRHTALIVVDPQHVFCSPRSDFVRKQGIDTSRVEETVPRLNRFIRACRQAGRHGRVRPAGPDRGDDAAQPAAVRAGRAGPHLVLPGGHARTSSGTRRWSRRAEGEPVITKHSFDAFQDTNLNLLLRNRGIRTLLITGFTSNVCVESTARHGFFNGYYIVLLSDCSQRLQPGGARVDRCSTSASTSAGW